MHTALWALAITSLVGALVCLLRPQHASLAAPTGEQEGSPTVFAAGADGAAANERIPAAPSVSAAHEEARA
jgi:hypothetical protein